MSTFVDNLRMGSRSLEISETEREVVAIIARAAEQRGWSGRRLGAEAGITKARISLLLRNERPVTVTDFVALCDALELSPVGVMREAEARLAARDAEVAVAAGERERAEVVQLGERRPDWPEGLPPEWELAAQVQPGADEELAETTGWRADLGEESQDIPYGEGESL